MALFPVTLQITIDEEGRSSVQVQEGKRLGAESMWLLAEIFRHIGDDLHQKDVRDMATRQELTRPGRPVMMPGGKPRKQ